MKKYISFFYFLIFFISVFLYPLSSVFAAAPTITLTFVNEKEGVTNGLTKLEWVLNITTTNIADGESISVGVYKSGVAYDPTIQSTKVVITNSAGSYNTGFVLDPLVKYQVIATYVSPNLQSSVQATFERIAKEGGVVLIDPKQATTTPENTYTLLAPIGTFTQAPNNVGDYLNLIFKIAIGLCAVLAVIMIVIGGIQYMGDESIFGKTEAKSQIQKALLGLVVALGAWALLNTINPALLGLNGVNITQASAGIEEAVVVVGSGVNINGTLIKISAGSAIACKGGIVSIPSNLGSGQICQDLLTKLLVLKSKMAAWGIVSTIRGGGAASSCHYSGYANSGNCADIQITNNFRGGYVKDTGGSTNAEWGNLCMAVAQVGGLNFLNEASSTPNCQNIQPYKAYPQTTGPHLHVNLISN